MMYYVRTRETVLEIKNSGSGCSYFLKAYWSAWKLYRFKLFLHRGINTAHKKFHARVNAVFVHVAYTVVTVHAICKDLNTTLQYHLHDL